MDKHEQAQRFAEIILKNDLDGYKRGINPVPKLEHVAYTAWKLADAMQDEVDKRKEKGFPEVVKDAEK